MVSCFIRTANLFSLISEKNTWISIRILQTKTFSDCELEATES
jgi:hypothetical protein